MTIRFLLLVNKQGQTRLANYNEIVPLDERRQMEGEIVRKCLARSDRQCSFVEHRNYKVIYRRYASLFFIVGRGTRFSHVHGGDADSSSHLWKDISCHLSCTHRTRARTRAHL